MQKIRVLVVDDHTSVRDGIRALLELASDIEVVGEAADGEEALEMARKLIPDVVLMDLAMPIMDGVEATRRLGKEFPEIKILALTQHDDREYIYASIEAGACGFISKRGAFSELASAIRSAYHGNSFFSPSVARILIEDYQHRSSERKIHDPYRQLTGREREILKLLAEGHSIQEIAEMLAISPKTVDGHKTSLMAKLDIHSRIDLVKYALRRGVITL